MTKRKAVKKCWPMRVWAHQNKETGVLTWICQPGETRADAAYCLYDDERLIRLTVQP